VVTTLSLRLCDALQIDPCLSLVTSPAKGCPIVGMIGAAKAQWYHVIVLHILQRFVASQALKTLQLQN
jgi:hypothetical protein